MNNFIELKFDSVSENEALARNLAVFYVVKHNPNLSFLSDIKTAVSEGVTNAIVHGYPDGIGKITMQCYEEDGFLHINIFDEGVGIENIENAIQPFYSTLENEEHSGMGFTIMKSFMDNVEIVSKLGQGTKVYMSKKIKADK